MEEKSSHSNRKRPFFEDEESNKPPMQKRVRFPKGKKVKLEDEVVDKRNTDDVKDPHLAAKERAKRRSQITTELFTEEGEGILNDVSAAEMNYQDNENFVEDGIQIEPFNLDNEREEGYFDANGNFVEYFVENEIKDAWLDSIETNPKYTGGHSALTNDIGNEDAAHDLSSDDIGMMKRRIANVLEPGETVLQALRRLKGTSNNRKEKMSVETKHIFDQLTEDADKLIQNGEYNVYHEKQEVFEREAEGYERLARARGRGTSLSIESPVTATEISSSGADDYDMFGDDDEHGTANPSSDGSNLASGPNSDAVSQLSSDPLNTVSETGALHNNFVNDGSSDYVYDDHSGYYYSSSLGYYYDPSTGLYCSAATGQWYSFNEETCTYDEIREVSSSVN